MGVPYFLLLSCLGLAITAQAQECSRPPMGPNMSLRDKDINLQQFPDNTEVGFVCDVGYTSAGGSRTIKCSGGTWTPLTLRCEKKNCGAFEDVDHGDIDYSEGTAFGAKIVITCNVGFRLVGRGEIFCQNNGWNGRKPTCEVVTCDQPGPINGGSFSPEEQSYNYRDVIQYSCQTDFTLNGSVSVSCSDDGTFKPAPPTCIRVQCEEPAIENAQWVSGSRPPYGYLATVTHRCNTGFKIIGSQTVVCNINSQWSPELPRCQMVTCAPPSKVEHGSFSPAKESYNYTNAVEYSCQTGFKLRGSKSRSCSEDGTFKPAPPTCTKDEGDDDKGVSGDSQKNLALGLGIFGGILALGLISICCYCFGIPAFKKKKGTDRTHPDTETPKVEENVPLSQPPPSSSSNTGGFKSD